MGMLNARASVWTCAGLLVVGSLAACAEEASSELAVASEATTQERASSGDEGQAKPVERKQIRDASMSIEVESCEAARREIEADVAERGGYVSHADLRHVDGRSSSARLVLRLPALELMGALQEYAALGVVLREELDARDITDDYYDVEARLGSARQLEGRLLGLLSTNTTELADVLRVEHELARVRESIERLEGKLRLWNDKVALSTLTIELVERTTFVAAAEPTFSARIDATFGRSWTALLSVGEALLMIVVALSVWILPVSLIVWLCRRLSQAVNQRRARSLNAS